MHRVLLGCLLLLLTTAVHAADLTMRRWEADVKFVSTEIFAPLAEHFAKSGEDFPLQVYLGALLESLQEGRDQLDPNTYLIMREITLGAAEDIYTFMNTACPDEVECASHQLDKWLLLQEYLKNKLDLVRNVMTILD